jgi:hypothetical protein
MNTIKNWEHTWPELRAQRQYLLRQRQHVDETWHQRNRACNVALTDEAQTRTWIALEQQIVASVNYVRTSMTKLDIRLVAVKEVAPIIGSRLQVACRKELIELAGLNNAFQP